MPHVSASYLRYPESAGIQSSAFDRPQLCVWEALPTHPRRRLDGYKKKDKEAVVILNILSDTLVIYGGLWAMLFANDCAF